MSILVLSVSILIIYYNNKYLKDNEILILEIIEYFEIAYSCASIIYCFVLFLYIFHLHHHNEPDQNATPKEDHRKEYFIDLLVLVLSNIILIIFCGFTLYAANKSLNSNTSNILKSKAGTTTLNVDKNKKLLELTIAASVLILIESIMQTAFIIYYTYLSNKINKKISNGFINILIYINFTIWLFDTFTAKKDETNEIYIYAYGFDLWDLVGIVFIPLTIFYRFHSCILLIKI